MLATNSRESAASVVTKVPTAPAIKLLPYMHIHFFKAGEIFEPAIGINSKSVNNATALIPKAINRAIAAFVRKPRLNITATPIPIMTLMIIEVPQLQEFCLHIVIRPFSEIRLIPINIICTKLILDNIA